MTVDESIEDCDLDVEEPFETIRVPSNRPFETNGVVIDKVVLYYIFSAAHPKKWAEKEAYMNRPPVCVHSPVNTSGVWNSKGVYKQGGERIRTRLNSVARSMSSR